MLVRQRFDQHRARPGRARRADRRCRFGGNGPEWVVQQCAAQRVLRDLRPILCEFASRTNSGDYVGIAAQQAAA